MWTVFSLVLSVPLSAILQRYTICLRCEIYSLTPKVTPRSEISAKQIFSFCQFKNFWFFLAILEMAAILKSYVMGP